MSESYRRRVRLALLGGLAILVSGCTKQIQVGPATVFVYARWVPLAIIAAGLTGTVWGILILRNLASERRLRESLPELARGTSSAIRQANDRISTFRYSLFAWWLLVFGPIMTVVYGPSFFHDKVLVNKERFSIQSGLWMLPRSEGAVFIALSKMELIREPHPRDQERADDYLAVYYKSGERRRFKLNDLMQRGAIEKIVEVAQSQNIPVEDKR